MALDFLPIQASSVASERAFSSAAETDTKRRNRLDPTFMEALQMVKAAVRKDGSSSDWDKWVTPTSMMTRVGPTGMRDPLASVLQGNQAVLDALILDET
jgi:hypothetical protein